MNEINCIRFNEDSSCFAIAHSRGYKVFNTDPVDQWVSRDFGSECGLSHASVLDRTNYLVLVGTNTQYSQKKVMVWNDQTQQASTISFDCPVLNCLVSREVVVAITEHAVHIHTLAPPHRLLLKVDTAINPMGLGALHKNRLAVPARKPGQLSLIDCKLAELKVSQTIPCHRSQLAAIAINDKFVATASVTGTLIRCYDLHGVTTKWFRRGLDRAQIYSIAFSPASERLAVLSDKRTLHIFDINSATNERHSLAPVAPNLYFNDEWSSCRIKTKSKEPGVLGWSSKDTVIVVRPSVAQWEKYAVIGTNLVPEAWRQIR